jgi:magnesium transporter
MKKSRKLLNGKLAKRNVHAGNTLAYVGDTAAPEKQKTIITKIVYSTEGMVECVLSLDDLANFNPANYHDNQKLWLNIHGVHDEAVIKRVGELFQLHPLVVEDILNTEQRPKLDEYADYLFLETRNFYYEPTVMSVSSEQISMVLGKRFLLTFQERPTGSFEHVRERLRNSRGHIRELRLDYLSYALLDSIVDRYFNVLEAMGEDSQTLEDALLQNPTNAELNSIHQLKRISIELRRAVWPLREVINNLTRNESDFFHPSTMPYLRDVYDHTVNFIESLEAIRDSLAGLMDIYMTSVSQRVNMELRALTVVAMLFMPATLIAGIFGMNFDYMPWLKDYNGFWWALAIMAGIAFIMIMIFWRRQWLSSKS